MAQHPSAAVLGALAVAGPASATTARTANRAGTLGARQPVASAPLTHPRPGAAAVQDLLLASAIVGRPYFDALPQSELSAGSWRVLAGTLPAGLSFDAASRAVVGLPTTAGTSRLVLVSGQAARTRRIRILQVSVGTAPVVSIAATRSIRPHTGTITGSVTAGTQPLLNACVTAISAAGATKTVLTSLTGTYSLTGLKPGAWELLFEGCANDDTGQWWKGQSTQTTAHAVTVTAGTVKSGVSVELHPGGGFSGTVTVAGTATGAAGVCVYAESRASLDGVPTVSEGAAETGPSGAYSVDGLSSGLYLVMFAPCRSGINLQPVWWKTQSDLMLAQTVSVTAGRTTPDISPALAAGAKITGTVTSATTHRPLAGVCVTASSEASLNAGPGFTYVDNIPIGSAETNAAGGYLISGIPSGDYLVEFVPCGPAAENYAPTYWHEANPFEASPTIAAPAGKTTGDVSEALTPYLVANGGSVSGKVTSASSGAPLANICVLIVNFNTDNGALATTGSKGDYLATGIPAGSYQAIFEPCDGQNYQETSWHHGASFKVRKGARTKGISVALSPGAVIEGTVESLHGTPLTGLCLITEQTSGSISTIDEGGPFAFGGDYKITALPPGAYTIGFSGCGVTNYGSQLWKGGATLTVKAGQVRSHIDVKLGPGGQITGVVRLSNSAAVSGACVSVEGGGESLSSPPVFASVVTVAGSYDAVGLTSGQYQVGFSPCSVTDDYQSAVWNGNVSVRAGAVTSGISGVLAAGGSISGTVTAVGGTPLSLVCVTAIGAFNGGQYEMATVGGSYDIEGLTPGSYEVEFSPCETQDYADQWWDDAAGQSSATPITVVTGPGIAGIDAVMKRA
jgi:hypothetical protein